LSAAEPTNVVPSRRDPRRTRMPAEDRRRSIVLAATAVFAELGFAGATTQQIARSAGVSEALLYQHFPSKLALHRAVLRQLVEHQDQVHEHYQPPAPSAEGLAISVEGYLRTRLLGPVDTAEVSGHRLLIASLTGDGAFARLTYRRALKLRLRPFASALTAARTNGDIEGEALDAKDAFWFVDHVGAMLLASRLSGAPTAPYGRTSEALLRDAVLFCLRGLGFTPAAVTRCYPPPGEP
jgi:AcrR family transcriptional regulator